jgi:hypothetical protein
MQTIYEVTVEVDEAIAREYQEWLEEHIDAIVERAGFEGARLYTFDGAKPGTKNWVTHYIARDHAVIANYLEKLAPEFRADGVQRFGERFRASRRILVLTADHSRSQIGATNRKDVFMATQVNWKKIRQEFNRFADVDKLKSEVQRIGSEIREFNFQSVLSPSAQTKVKKFEKRYNELMKSIHTAQRQVDKEFNKVITQIKGQRIDVKKAVAEQKQKLEKASTDFQKRFSKKAAAAAGTKKKAAKTTAKKTATKKTATKKRA